MMKQRALRILWPAFLMAGLLEIMVFAVVDPGDLHWFGGPAIGWSSQAIYTVTFMIFWAAVSTAGAITAMLWLKPDELNRPDSARPGG